MAQQPPQQTSYGAQSGNQQFGQQPYGQQQYGQQQPGGQPGQQGQQGQQTQLGGTPGGQGMGMTLEDGLSGEMRLALHDFVQSADVTEWCADQCIDLGPQMAECIRLCRDVADLASLNARFITRDSTFGPELAEVFARAADECARECAQHEHEHCKECASVLRRASQSTRQLLDTVGQGQQQTPMQ